MRKLSITFLLLVGTALASAAPTTQPRDIAPTNPPVRSYVGSIADLSRPAYVPAFATNRNTPALQAERDQAMISQVPSAIYSPWIFGPRLGCYGYVANHGFYR